MTSDNNRNVAPSLMSLAILQVQLIKSTSLRSRPVVSTYSYQKQHQLKYLIWPFPTRSLIRDRSWTDIKDGSCPPLLLVKIVCSHVNLFVVCVEKAQTKQLRERGWEMSKHTRTRACYFTFITLSKKGQTSSVDHIVKVRAAL